MIKIALVFDNIGQSNILKGFFQSCASDLKMFLEAHEKELVEISGSELNHNTIHTILTSFINRFVFASFSHGEPDSLICSHNPREYISMAVNASLFKEAFFYTWSCHTSASLGDVLRKQHGCSVYWGYKGLIWAPTDADHQGIFIQCANRGIEQFFLGKNVHDAKENAVEFYNEKIDELADINYPLSSRLRINRDAMDVQGDLQLTIVDFYY